MPAPGWKAISISNDLSDKLLKIGQDRQQKLGLTRSLSMAEIIEMLAVKELVNIV